MAALPVSLVGLVYRADSARGVAEVSGIFGLVLGSGTFSASLLAAAASGLIVDNRLLVTTGAAVAASDSVLTPAMCKAMNRGLGQILWGGEASGPEPVRWNRPRIASKGTESD